MAAGEGVVTGFSEDVGTPVDPEFAPTFGVLVEGGGDAVMVAAPEAALAGGGLGLAGLAAEYEAT